MRNGASDRGSAWIPLAAAAWALALALLESPAEARLSASPRTDVGETWPSGTLRVANGTAYVPAPIAAARRPAPLLVLFHGTSGSGRAMLNHLRPFADHYGMVLLATSSVTDENWDAVDSFFDQYERGGAAGRTVWPVPSFGRDERDLDAALAALFARLAIDPSRIGALGYSHGASYALSIGSANPRLFSAILAFSPGILALEPGDGGGRLVYVAHGERDRTLPFARTRDSFVPRLRALGYRVTFRPFGGGHETRPAELEEAIRLFLAAPRR